MSEPLRGVVDCLKTIVSRRHWNDVGDAELLRTFNETHDSDVFRLSDAAAWPDGYGAGPASRPRSTTGRGCFSGDLSHPGSQEPVDSRPRDAAGLAAPGRAAAGKLEPGNRDSAWRNKHNHASQAAASDPLEEICGCANILTILDEEIARLPETFRLPVILCHLEGLSREEAAKRLGVSASSIKGMLERGRQMLRKRLSSRGLPGVVTRNSGTGGHVARRVDVSHSNNRPRRSHESRRLGGSRGSGRRSDHDDDHGEDQNRMRGCRV